MVDVNDISFLAFGLLTLLAFFAGWVSSIAGAGGMITLPALLWVGLPPLNAMAVNKVQSALGTLSSMYNYARNGHIDFRSMGGMLAGALVGAVFGTLTARAFGDEILDGFIPIMLIGVGLFMLFKPSLGDDAALARMSKPLFSLSVAPAIGFYGGLFGPGMGSIMPLLFVIGLGYRWIAATAETKVIIFAVNGISALVFVSLGLVYWPLAISMALAQMLGARIGSGMAMKRGERFIQIFLIVVTLLMAVSLLFYPS